MFFRQGRPKAQAILYVLPSIWNNVGGKTATESGKQDLISGYLSRVYRTGRIYARGRMWEEAENSLSQTLRVCQLPRRGSLCPIQPRCRIVEADAYIGPRKRASRTPDCAPRPPHPSRLRRATFPSRGRLVKVGARRRGDSRIARKEKVCGFPQTFSVMFN